MHSSAENGDSKTLSEILEDGIPSSPKRNQSPVPAHFYGKLLLHKRNLRVHLCDEDFTIERKTSKFHCSSLFGAIYFPCKATKEMN